MFKILINNQPGDLHVSNLEIVINELCGTLPDQDCEFIIEKTFATFNADRNSSITESQFVNVKVFIIKIILFFIGNEIYLF